MSYRYVRLLTLQGKTKVWIAKFDSGIVYDVGNKIVMSDEIDKTIVPYILMEESSTESNEC